MKKVKESLEMIEPWLHFKESERGAALIVVILVLAFMLTIGLVLLTVTGTGSNVAANIRTQQQAFNAAEAGFDASWFAIEDLFVNGGWASFDGHYLSEPDGIDIPSNTNYFRKLTDLELLHLLDADDNGTCDYPSVISFKQTYHIDENGDPDTRYTYTTFLINDEAGGGTPDPGDVLLICIGVFDQGSNIATSRLEVEIEIEGTI